MAKFPLSMPYLVKAVKNKQDFLRRYDEIFKGEANAAQCFASCKPLKESTQRYEVYCPFVEAISLSYVSFWVKLAFDQLRFHFSCDHATQ
jgi:hypothetical protein